MIAAVGPDRARLAGVLALANLLALALCGWLWLSPAGGESPMSLRTGPGPALPAVAPEPLPPLEAFPETTARPLFLSTRSTVPQAVGPAPAGSDDLLLGRYRFAGVVVAPGRSILMLKPAGGGAMERVRVGDRLEGWSVAEIGRDFVVLEKDGERQTFPLLAGESRQR